MDTVVDETSIKTPTPWTWTHKIMSRRQGGEQAKDGIGYWYQSRRFWRSELGGGCNGRLKEVVAVSRT